MTLKNIKKEDAELYLRKFSEQLESATSEKKFIKILYDNGVNEFSTPYNVSWEITAGCNLRCKHCCFANEDYDSKNDVSTQTALDFAQQLIENDLIKIMITGGEPFLRKDLFTIIELLKSKNVIIELTSNATLITDENADKLSKLLNPICDYIQVSLDGASPEVHEKTRGLGSYNKTINGIKKLIKHGINVTLNCVVTKTNIHQMCELFDLAENLGVSLITYSRIYTDNKDLLPDKKQLFKETIKLLKHEKLKPKINLRLFNIPELAANRTFYSFFDGNFPVIEDFSCNRKEKLHIRKDGEVFLCLYASNKNLFSLGNIKKDSLENILNNMKTNPLLKKRIITDTKCNSCALQFYCKAGCPINAFLNNGNISSFDPVCTI